jgi:hypothetical protein
VTPGHDASDQPITWRQAGVTALVTLAVFAAAGLLGGGLWAAITEPPSYVVTRPLPDPLPTDAFPTDSFDSDAWFLVLGVVGGLVCGFACTALFRHTGLVVLAAVLAGAALASFVVNRLGMTLGPPPIAQQARDAGVGDVLSFPLHVGATGVFLGWPFAAVAGLMLAVSLLTPLSVPGPDDPIVS